MTYAAIETSTQSGRPVELYEFQNGSVYFRYTSADGDVVYASNTYTAVPISRGAVEASNETARMALDITCDRTLGVLGLFSPMPPDDIVSVTVRRLHAGDGEAITLWMGRVLNITWDVATSEIHCESIYVSIKRSGLRRLYQKSCPHVIYGVGCSLNRVAFKTTTGVSAVSGTTLGIPGAASFSDGYFSGGYIEWNSGGGVMERRAIRSQVGATVVISFPLPGIAVSASVDLYPGCDHTIGTCNTKFSNQLNYGGMPYFPDKNPFSGTPIY